MQSDDLADFSSEWVEPISIDYRGWKVYEFPPNGQGMAALEMLNIMETFPPAPAGPQGAAELHKRIEAMKLAYSDLYRYNADPRFAKVPVAGLLSKTTPDNAPRSSILKKQIAQLPAAAPPAAIPLTWRSSIKTATSLR